MLLYDQAKCEALTVGAERRCVVVDVRVWLSQ